METNGSKQASLVMWLLTALLLSQKLVIHVKSDASLGDQMWFYSPDPHAGTSPTDPHKSPSHGSGGSYGSPTPVHRTPSHGGSGSHGGRSPPPGCEKPPSGGHHYPTPAPPKGGNSGGYYHSPPTSGGSSHPKSPPPTFEPKLPPFTGTCDFWRSHPGLILGLFGWWGTLGGAFGVSTNTNPRGFLANISLLQALSDKRRDGLGELYREGTASLLNSMVNQRFPYTTKHVRATFLAALSSDNAAAAQAQLFKLANEGRLIIKP